MMSNYGFWSRSGELLALHGVEGEGGGPDPRQTFGPWAAALRLPPGRLVSLSAGFPWPVLGPGWQPTRAVVPPRSGKPPRPCEATSAVAVFAPVFDRAASLVLPAEYQHEQFTLRSWPTWVTEARPDPEEGPEGWFAAVQAGRESLFLVRLVPHRGRLPGDGWRNMLAWATKAHVGVKLVRLNHRPRPEVLARFPAWEYRVEAGRDGSLAAWDVQVLPSRGWLQGLVPGVSDPWEATAVLRWVRPGATADRTVPPGTEPRWADLFGRWSVADARLVVQNVLNVQPGGAATSAALFFEALSLPPGPDGRTLVRYVPQPGLPVALLSTLFGRRAWAEIERSKRLLPTEAEARQLRSEVLADLDRRLAEGRLVWSAEADEVWQRWYREPLHRARQKVLDEVRASSRWAEVLAGDPRTLEFLLRSLDVTDAALCLRDVPDRRWRQFVTARREAELREELEFCRVWEARGELTVERQLEAWRSWDDLVRLEP